MQAFHGYVQPYPQKPLHSLWYSVLSFSFYNSCIYYAGCSVGKTGQGGGHQQADHKVAGVCGAGLPLRQGTYDSAPLPSVCAVIVSCTFSLYLVVLGREHAASLCGGGEQRVPGADPAAVAKTRHFGSEQRENNHRNHICTNLIFNQAGVVCMQDGESCLDLATSVDVRQLLLQAENTGNSLVFFAQGYSNLPH